MTLPSIQDPNRKAFYLLVCEDKRRSNNVARVVRWGMSHGVNRSNMNNLSNTSSTVAMVLLVVAAVTRRDNIFVVIIACAHSHHLANSHALLFPYCSLFGHLDDLQGKIIV
jgi:hypothetical protein